MQEIKKQKEKWKKNKLSDVAEYIRRGITPKYVEKKGLIVLNQKCVRNHRVNFEEAKLTDLAKKIIKEKKLRKYDVLVNSTGVGTLGRVAQYKFDVRATVDSHITIVRPKERKGDLKIDQRFFGYSIIKQQPVIESLGIGATGQTELSRQSIGNDIEILLPDYLTQKQIADILSTYDDLIENNTRRIKILEELAQVIYKEWLVRFRFPGHEKVKMVDSNTEFGKIPEGWEISRVERLIERVSPGKLYDNKSSLKKGDVPILDQGRSGVIGYHNNEPGIFASIDNPVIVFANHTCYQNLILFPFSAIQNVLPFYPSKDNYRNIFWLHYTTKDLIKFNDYKGHWPEFIQKMVLLPPIELTEKFENEIKSLLILSHLLELKNKNLRKSRDLLLPKLVTGEIEV
jgi:type I restriction enzyme, S subunit